MMVSRSRASQSPEMTTESLTRKYSRVFSDCHCPVTPLLRCEHAFTHTTARFEWGSPFHRSDTSCSAKKLETTEALVPRAIWFTLSPPGPERGRSTTPLGPTLPSLVTAREYRSYCDLLYVHQVPGHGWARRAASSRGRRHVKCSGRWLCLNQRRRLK